MRCNPIGTCIALAAVAVAGSANAAVVYNSLPTSAVPVLSISQGYSLDQITELGGKIRLAGTDRQLSSATVKMKSPSPNGETGSISLTFNVYAVANDGSIGSLLGTRSQTFTSAAGNMSNPGISDFPIYDCTFDLSGLGVTLPGEIYYGVALDYSGGGIAASTAINLWNYGSKPGDFPIDPLGAPWVGRTDTYVDGAATAGSYLNGTAVTTGTDLITGTWGRSWFEGTLYTFDGNDPFYHGMTPNVSISAVPAPGAVALLGLGGLVGSRRRRS
jgi:MYXO-CTERM domain-containing protein